MSGRISKNRLRQFIKLKQKKFRQLQMQYILSGERAVKQVLQDTSIQVDAFLITPDMEYLRTQLVQIHPFLGKTETFILSDRDFKQLTEEPHPQGIALILKKPDTIFKTETDPGKISIYLDRISDPGNLGTIIRTAAWFSIDSILLSPDSADPFQNKAVRATAGSISRLKIYEDVTPENLSALKVGFGYDLIASVMSDGMPLKNLAFSEKVILMFGSEAHGLDSKLIEDATQLAYIPQTGFGESLNLGIAVGCFLYHLRYSRIEV
jgi:TrmH family RNA methyltransferase